MLMESRIFYGRNSIDSFTCTVKQFDILKAKNVLVLRHGAQRLQTRFNFIILSALFYSMRHSSSLHSCFLHQNIGHIFPLIFTYHVNKGHFKNVSALQDTHLNTIEDR